MQLSSCANLYAIIFFKVKCREVLVVVGGIATMTLNTQIYDITRFVSKYSCCHTLMLSVIHIKLSLGCPILMEIKPEA
jgi:hypothetical protein